MFYSYAMHIVSALRRKRDEIAAKISIFELRIDAAKREMAALEEAARLIHPEGGGEDTALHPEFERAGQQQQIRPAHREVWDSECAPAIGQLALTSSGARDFGDEEVESIGVQKPQFTEEVAHSAMHRIGEQIPAEFFYFNWP
jgi:hypothetical protein